MRMPIIGTLCFIVLVFLISACTAPAQEPAADQLDRTASTSSKPTVKLGCNSPSIITSTLPADTFEVTQAAVNCFAWQSFIALNWPADPIQRGMPDASKRAQDFGAPTVQPVSVWQTYKLPEDVFLPGAATPAPWNTPDTFPDACASIVGTRDITHMSVLHMTSKQTELFAHYIQADGGILVDQRGHLVRYEERLNQPEFDYIVHNQLYDASVQAVVAAKGAILLPEQSIELKAAWRELDNSADPSRYKTLQALLYDAKNNTCRGPVTMGLVGLHIVRKTAHMNKMMWATFEQVDNLPRPGSDIYPSFNNPSCTTCVKNATPQSTSQPVQVVREVPISQTVQALNTTMQANIRQVRSDSVWQYYQLIDVLWPEQNGRENPIATVIIPIDITLSSFATSSKQALSNVTMETYSQKRTCVGCHVSAAIAPLTPNTTPIYAADFSFVFSKASVPSAGAVQGTPSPAPASCLACHLSPTAIVAAR